MHRLSSGHLYNMVEPELHYLARKGHNDAGSGLFQSLNRAEQVEFLGTRPCEQRKNFLQSLCWKYAA